MNQVPNLIKKPQAGEVVFFNGSKPKLSFKNSRLHVIIKIINSL